MAPPILFALILEVGTQTPQGNPLKRMLQPLGMVLHARVKFATCMEDNEAALNPGSMNRS